MKLLAKALQAYGFSRSRRYMDIADRRSFANMPKEAAASMLDTMIDGSMLNHKGFRVPSEKQNRLRMPTAMEQLAYSSGLTDELGNLEGSPRGNRRRAGQAVARKRMAFMQDRLNKLRAELGRPNLRLKDVNPDRRAEWQRTFAIQQVENA